MIDIVNCPICKIEVQWNTKNKYRPFCSERCKNIDLGDWAKEKYSISELKNSSQIDEC